MTKDWSNLKNQPKKVEETTELEEIEEVVENNETIEEIEEEEEVVEVKKPKVSKVVEVKKIEEGNETYFVNSRILNLGTLVGAFIDGLFIASTEEEKDIIRKTEDYQRGFVKEYTKAEYEKIKK